MNSQYQQIASQSTAIADDIIKMGNLKKGKKGKKRFFVLRQDSYTAPARLDCYDSDKRFRQGVQPKLSVKLKDVFNINKTVVDLKLKNCVGIFARDETLTLGCETVQDQDAWLYTLLNVYNSAKSGTPEENSRPNFDNVWDVILTEKGLTDKKNPQLRGAYRFCLTPCSIYLYRKSTDEECIEFPLVYIANYGHKQDMLFLRVGRSASTGSGELWMQTTDPAVAQNIHETMKRILEENHEHRQRSSSLTTDTMKQNLRGSLSHVRGAYSGGNEEKIQPMNASFSGKLQSYSNHRIVNSPVSWLRGASHTSSSRRCSVDSSSVASGSTESDIGSKTYPSRQINERAVSLEYVSNQPTIYEEGAAAANVSDYTPMNPASTVSISRSAGELPRRLSNELDRVDEYEPMAPSTKSSATSSARQWNLEEVRSYISDGDSTASSSLAIADIGCHSLGSKSITPPIQGSAPSSLISRITQAWSGVTTSDDRQRAHSFGSWNKHHVVRKHSTSLVRPTSGVKDKDDDFRQRSESFGSGRPSSSAMAKFLDRFSSKRSTHSEDLVEIEFGPSPPVGGSLSGSLSSSESLFRSRTSSLSNAASGRQSWSPKIEQITEQHHDTCSPSAKLIQKLLCDRRLSDLRTPTSSDYVAMSVAPPTSTTATASASAESHFFAGGDDHQRSSEYVIVNSRRRHPAHFDCCNQRLVGSFDVHYMDTSSGYSSTGDCSEIGQHSFKTNTAIAAVDDLKPFVVNPTSNAAAPKCFAGAGGLVQPTRRLSDVQAEEEVMRRFAKVDMDSPKSLSPVPRNATCFNFDQHKIDNMKLNRTFSGDLGKAAAADFVITKDDDAHNNNRILTDAGNKKCPIKTERSPSSLSSNTPTPSPMGSGNVTATDENLQNNCTTPPPVDLGSILHRLDVVAAAHQKHSSLMRSKQTCRTPSPKQALSDTIPNISGAHNPYETAGGGQHADMSFAEVDMSKIETLTKLAAKS